MIVLATPAPKASGLASGQWFYVATECRREDGRPYATISKDVRRAKRFDNEAEADMFNEKMMRAGYFEKPFKKIKLNDNQRFT